jgi:hypothetical protein
VLWDGFRFPTYAGTGGGGTRSGRGVPGTAPKRGEVRRRGNGSTGVRECGSAGVRECGSAGVRRELRCGRGAGVRPRHPRPCPGWPACLSSIPRFAPRHPHRAGGVTVRRLPSRPVGTIPRERCIDTFDPADAGQGWHGARRAGRDHGTVELRRRGPAEPRRGIQAGVPSADASSRPAHTRASLPQEPGRPSATPPGSPAASARPPARRARTPPAGRRRWNPSGPGSRHGPGTRGRNP